MNTVNKEAYIKQIIDTRLGKPDCKACGLGTACCGCPAAYKYREVRQNYVAILGEEVVKAAERVADIHAKREDLKAELLELDKAYKKANAELDEAKKTM